MEGVEWMVSHAIVSKSLSALCVLPGSILGIEAGTLRWYARTW
jgi:hypothetical protein